MTLTPESDPCPLCRGTGVLDGAACPHCAAWEASRATRQLGADVAAGRVPRAVVPEPVSEADLQRAESLAGYPHTDVWSEVRQGTIAALVAEVRRLRARLAEVEAAEEQGRKSWTPTAADLAWAREVFARPGALLPEPGWDLSTLLPSGRQQLTVRGPRTRPEAEQEAERVLAAEGVPGVPRLWTVNETGWVFEVVEEQGRPGGGR